MRSGSFLLQVQIRGDQIFVFTAGRWEHRTIGWGSLEQQVARLVRAVAGARNRDETGLMAEYIVVTADASLDRDKLRQILANPELGEVITERSAWQAAA